MKHIAWKGIPRVDITLVGGVTVDTIDKETKSNAMMVITNNHGSAFAPEELYNGYITIKGRGNYTWTLPKKPYNIVTTDSAYKKTDSPLFGMAANPNWCLLAQYEEKTHIRNQFTNSISDVLELPWVSQSLHVEVYIDGEYRGLYEFAEKVERAPARINITNLKAGDVVAPAITGGYVIEQMTPDQVGPDEVSFVDSSGKTFSYKVPDSDEVVTAQNDYIKAYWDSFLYKVFNEPFNDTVNGYKSVIYLESFAKYFLLQDLSVNWDAYKNSWYTTKNRSDKMNAGPGWDFNLTWGCLNESIVQDPLVEDYLEELCPYYAKMLTDPEFKTLVETYYEQYIEGINKLFASVQRYVRNPTFREVVARDRVRWPDILSDAYFIPTASYQAEIDRFEAFVKDRLHSQTRKVYLPLTPTSATVRT